MTDHNAVHNTSADLFQARAICRSSLLSFVKNDRVSQASCIITWTRRCPFKYQYKSYQQLATHLFKRHYVQGSMTFSWQASLPRKHWSLCSLSSLLPCRRKHLPIPPQAHEDPRDCPFPCWEVGQQSCSGALKSLIVRGWWYNLYKFVSASVPTISELPSQLFTKILQVTKHTQVTAGAVDQIVAIPNTCFYSLSCSTWIAGTSSYLPKLSPALQHLVTKESINRSSFLKQVLQLN